MRTSPLLARCAILGFAPVVERALWSGAPSRTFSTEDSHDDFKPKSKAPAASGDMHAFIDEVTTHVAASGGSGGGSGTPPPPKRAVATDALCALTTCDPQKVHGNKVMLFMKGTATEPRCGFSMQVVRILNAYGTWHQTALCPRVSPRFCPPGRSRIGYRVRCVVACLRRGGQEWSSATPTC